MNEMQGAYQLITGLSSSKIISHLFQNNIHGKILKIWKIYSQEIQSSVDRLSTSSTSTTPVAPEVVIQLLNELHSDLINISWEDSNTLAALKSLPLLLLDIFKMSAMYFSHPSSDFHSTYSTSLIFQITTLSTQILRELRLEKHFDTLLNDIPAYLLILQNSLSPAHSSSSSSTDISSNSSQLVIQLLDLIQFYSITYTNRKKLFTNGIANLLKPFLSLYSLLLPMKNQFSWGKNLLKSIDNVVTQMFFDDIHHIEELAQISLQSLISFHQSSLLSTEKKRKNEGQEATTDKKQKISKGIASKQSIHSYHMSFYSTIAEWAQLQSSQLYDQVLFSLEHFLLLYFHSSKEIANISDRNISFVQKWRLHIKRVLHLGLGLIYSLCGDKADDDRLCVPLLKIRNTILKSLNRGLSGNTDADLESATSTQTGAIPDHELLNTYVQKFQELGESFLNRAVSSSNQLRDLTQDGAGLIRVLSVDIEFLGCLVDFDCRTVSDTSLPLMLHIVGNVFAWRKGLVASSEIVSREITTESMKLFLKLLELYANLRRVDIFLKAIFEDINVNDNDQAYSEVLNNSVVQEKLYHVFGTMADGQRNSCWEAFLSASPNWHIADLKEDVSTLPEAIPLRTYFSLSSLVGALGLSVPPYRAVPEDLLVLLLSEVMMCLSAHSKEENMSLFDITSLVSLTSTLMKIASNFLSSSSFATFIPRYPYKIQYSPALNDPAGDRTPNSEDVWITFCIICSKLNFDLFPEFLQVAKDRLLSDDLPDILFTTDSCQLISLILKSLPTILQSNHDDYSSSVENLFECLVELVFNFYSLLSVASVPLSPLHQRCLEIELSDSFESSQHTHFGEIFESTISKFRSQMLFTFFQFFTTENSLISRRPALSLLFLNQIKIWGSLFNTLISSNQSEEVSIVKSFADSIMSPLFLEHQNSARILHILIQPQIQSYPFLLDSVGRVCRQQISEFQDLQSLSKLLHTTSQLPIAVLLAEWEILVSTCSNILNQFFVSVRGRGTLEACLLSSSQFALRIITQIVSDALLHESDQLCVRILYNLLDGFVANQQDMALVETIAAVSKSDFGCVHNFMEELENLLTILSRHIFPLLAHSDGLLNKFSLFLCGLDEKCESRESIFQIVVCLGQQLIQSLILSDECNDLTVAFSFRLLKNICEFYCENSLKRLLSESREAKSSHISDPFEALLEKLVDVLLNGATNYGDSLYRLIGDIYLMLICQRNEKSGRYLTGTFPTLDKHLATLAFSPRSLGAGWLHFLAIFLECNGRSVSSSASRYISLPLISLVVGNLSNLFQSYSVTDVLHCSEYTSSVRRVLQILVSVVPPNLRERLVASPLIKMAFQFPIRKTKDSQFIFAIIETLLKIGFCEWRDSDSNSEFCRNYKKFMIQNACWYSERMSTQDDPASPMIFFDHVIIASQLYQLQLKSLSASRNLKLDKVDFDEGSTGRQFEGVLSSLLFSSVISFLSLTTSRLYSFQDVTHFGFISAVIALLHLLLDLLSSSHYPTLNSNAGSLVITIRHLIVIGIKSLSTPQIKSENKAFPIDILRLLGRVLMALSSNKHLQRHAHLFVACTIEVLSGYATIQEQQQRQLKTNFNSSTEQGAESITISSHDETLREHVFPGIFALLDKCRTIKQRKQIFSILDERSRLMFNDLNQVYQQDYKFLGKA